MYTHFTEYHIYEAVDTKAKYIVMVTKNNIKRCVFVDAHWPLSKALTFLDEREDSGWLTDQDVGAHIATYSITTHPELFI